MREEAIRELLYKMADDQLILGHRNSEWTGFGPLLEEDIAFSSMAQDKIGHSYAIYQMLNDLGEQDPDTIAFMRPANEFKNSIFVELPNGEYDFSLVRHFLFDMAEYHRFELLVDSGFTPLAQLAAKIKGELLYHVMHAKTWTIKLGNANATSITRLQRSLDEAFPFALGMFEPSPFEAILIENNFFSGERVLSDRWLRSVSSVINQTKLSLPSLDAVTPVVGGRQGIHNDHLQPLLDEMSEVFRQDPSAEW